MLPSSAKRIQVLPLLAHTSTQPLGLAEGADWGDSHARESVGINAFTKMAKMAIQCVSTLL
jgi:hypothetical protein